MSVVNFVSNPADLRVLILGSLGFSTEFIRRHTRLTESQIGYRLQKGGVRRVDYRNGQSPVCNMVLRSAEVEISNNIRRRVERQNRAIAQQQRATQQAVPQRTQASAPKRNGNLRRLRLATTG